MKIRTLIMGAAGRDFHDFNVYFRDNPAYEVVGFTQSSEQNLGELKNKTKRSYPPALSGRMYPKGIPIFYEEDLPGLIKKYKIPLVILAYSDLGYVHLMHKAALINSCGAAFGMLGLETMIKPRKPVVAVTAVRTGCGKSQTTRAICEMLKKQGKRVVVVRHPMPYGDLEKQAVQRFANERDLEFHNCTIEEREEYEPIIRIGAIVYAGVDYEKILRQAEKEADIIIWDGGNNDFPFYAPDAWVVILDPLRPGHEITYYPGEINLRMADIAVVNKVKQAKRKDLEEVLQNIKKYNKKGKNAEIILADSAVSVDRPELIRNKKVIVVEDGPTLTHGGMHYGAGIIAAKRFGAKPVNCRPYATGTIKKIFGEYRQLNNVLPAMGYSAEQIKELEQTINKTPADVVLCATPINLKRILKLNKPIVRVRYDLKEMGGQRLERQLIEKLHL